MAVHQEARAWRLLWKITICFVIFLFQSMSKHGLNYRWILRLQLMRFRLKPCLAAPWLKFPTYWKSLRILSWSGCNEKQAYRNLECPSQGKYRFNAVIPTFQEEFFFVPAFWKFLFRRLEKGDMKKWNEFRRTRLLEYCILRKKCALKIIFICKTQFYICYIILL